MAMSGSRLECSFIRGKTLMISYWLDLYQTHIYEQRYALLETNLLCSTVTRHTQWEISCMAAGRTDIMYQCLQTLCSKRLFRRHHLLPCLEEPSESHWGRVWQPSRWLEGLTLLKRHSLILQKLFIGVQRNSMRDAGNIVTCIKYKTHSSFLKKPILAYKYKWCRWSIEAIWTLDSGNPLLPQGVSPGLLPTVVGGFYWWLGCSHWW